MITRQREAKRMENYDQDSEMVALEGRGWLSLKQVFDAVKQGRLTENKVPDYPVAGRGWYPAHKAYEILHPPSRR
jgi:hypothetical protein